MAEISGDFRQGTGREFQGAIVGAVIGSVGMVGALGDSVDQYQVIDGHIDTIRGQIDGIKSMRVDLGHKSNQVQLVGGNLIDSSIQTRHTEIHRLTAQRDQHVNQAEYSGGVIGGLALGAAIGVLAINRVRRLLHWRNAKEQPGSNLGV